MAGQFTSSQEERLHRLEHLLDTIEKMMMAQQVYFKNRLSGDLRISKQWESEVRKQIVSLRSVEDAAERRARQAELFKGGE